ncbi:Nuclear protein MDM1 [Bienertia sinuspersici]
MFLIRFQSMENRDKVLAMGRVFFDYKPVILKAWHVDMEINKEDIQKIPIWVQLDLHFKYWGQKFLERIIQPVGNLLKVDTMTANRDKLQYARCMIEVKMDQMFPEQVKFKNEKNEIINVGIKYEWKPETCKKCKKLGHNEEQCYVKDPKKKMAKEWKQKKVDPQAQENNKSMSMEGNQKESRQKEIERSNIETTNQEKLVNSSTKAGNCAGKETQPHCPADEQKEGAVVEKEEGNKEQNYNNPVVQSQSLERAQHGDSENVDKGIDRMGGTRSKDGGRGGPSSLNG